MQSHYFNLYISVKLALTCSFTYISFLLINYQKALKLHICTEQTKTGHFIVIKNILKLCMNNKRDGCQIKYFSLFLQACKIIRFPYTFWNLFKKCISTACSSIQGKYVYHHLVLPHIYCNKNYPTQSMKYRVRVSAMVLNATFNNSSVISS